jgi:tRNA-dihydrouridine synthase
LSFVFCLLLRLCLCLSTPKGEQRSRDAPDWEAIREVKDVVMRFEPQCPIKIIGNGDVRTAEDVVRMTQTTGCDGIMVGRAAMRNPWIFKELVSAVGGGGGGSGGSSVVGGGKSVLPVPGALKNEWPSLCELERAEKVNRQWSEHRKAASRYSPFRTENYARLRALVSTAHVEATSDSDRHENEKQGDWYEEWSSQATRRQYLERKS